MVAEAAPDFLQSTAGLIRFMSTRCLFCIRTPVSHLRQALGIAMLIVISDFAAFGLETRSLSCSESMLSQVQPFVENLCSRLCIRTQIQHAAHKST